MIPVLSALRHHKTTVVLVALEIALTCAIITNALFLIRDRLVFMHLTTGVADKQLVWVETHAMDLGQDAPKTAGAGLAEADMAALRALPGVRSVAMTNALPLGQRYSSAGVYRRPGVKADGIFPVLYLGTPGWLSTLGAKLSEGRDFQPQEYVDYRLFGDGAVPTTVIVTSGFAQKMWPGEDALGKSFYMGKDGTQVTHVVGVIGHLLNPSINQYQGVDRGVIFPVSRVRGGAMYVLRMSADVRSRVSQAIPDALRKIDPARNIHAHIYTDTIATYFQGDRVMVWLLMVVIGCLLLLTALGVIGLSSFWVQQRTRTIGIRRAIGATRGDILRYFLVENFLIVSMGVVGGALCAIGLNLWLMRHYELHRMPLIWLPVGALVLWGLGVLSVLGPAMRASRVPPVVATRNL